MWVFGSELDYCTWTELKLLRIGLPQGWYRPISRWVSMLDIYCMHLYPAQHYIGRSLLLQDSLMHQAPKLQSPLILLETAVGGTLVDIVI